MTNLQPVGNQTAKQRLVLIHGATSRVFEDFGRFTEGIDRLLASAGSSDNG